MAISPATWQWYSANPGCGSGIFLRLSDDHFGTPGDRALIEHLEDVLTAVLPEKGVGEFDGNQVGKGWYELFLYGPSAKDLAAVAIRLVRELVPVRPGSYFVQRYGEPGSLEERCSL